MQIACDVIYSRSYTLQSKKYYLNYPAESIQTLHEYDMVV